jgi:ABC-type bacteriocin/lantibiotic exporter with double-glycine peptidase domain
LGLIENIGYLLIGPLLAEQFGLISLEDEINRALKSFGFLFEVKLPDEAYFLVLVMLLIYLSRASYSILLNTIVKDNYDRTLGLLEKKVLGIVCSGEKDTSSLVAKTILSDLTTSTYTYVYNHKVLVSTILPTVILILFCIFTLGVEPTLILSGWLLILFAILKFLLNKSSFLGEELNRINVLRYDQTNEFIITAKLAYILRVYNFLWGNIKELNERYSKAQFLIQLMQTFPKLLIEVFLIVGVLLIYQYYKYQGDDLNSFILDVTLISAALYKLMPLGINIANSLIQLKSSKAQHDSLWNVINHSDEIEDYIIKTNDYEMIIDNIYIKNRLGANTRFSLEINSPGVYAVMGESGSGKSTLSDVITGILCPDEGRVLINSRHFNEDNRLIVGRSFQDPIITNNNLRDNINFFGANELKNIKYIESLGISHLDNGRIFNKGMASSQISGGEAKRIDFLRTMESEAKLLIFDEPEAGLDSLSKMKLLDLLKGLGSAYTVIVFTHDFDVANSCKEIIEISK